MTKVAAALVQCDQQDLSGEPEGSRQHQDPAEWDPEGGSLPADGRLQKSQQRNARRIREADRRDRKIIGEFFPSSMSALFPCRLVGPDDSGGGSLEVGGRHQESGGNSVPHPVQTGPDVRYWERSPGVELGPAGTF